jgi:predicted DNA-binding transcriptional regulator YafY
MQPYSDYKKSRRLFEMYSLIKSGEATTKQELAKLFGESKRTIFNYINELNEEFETRIVIKPGTNKYIIEKEGLMGLLKVNSKITSDDVFLIIFSLVQSQYFIETKMAIIKNALLNLLPIEENKKLTNIMHFDKHQKYDEQIIESNITTLRKAIGDEKKVAFNYVSGSGQNKSYKLVPYSFACELGKYYIIGKPDNSDSLTHLRIDRMGIVVILDEKGERNSKFNVYDYLKRTWYMYSGLETKVIVRFSKGCKAVVTERNIAEGRILEETEDNFIYEFTCNGTKGIKLWIMGFGRDAEVLDPHELKNEIRDEIKGMMKTYGL